jgi:DNA invertase Pin-like site-specific DNA recombinase
MPERRYVSYLRVSTREQGRSGLGLEGQRQAVATYLNGGQWELVAEFVEVESGRRANRPQLAAALATCRVHRATLVIAKIDRLSRNAAFLLNLRDAGVDFVAADMPDANRMTIGIMAVMAEAEADMISARTKAALVVVKERRKAAGLPPLGGARAGAAERARQVAAKGSAAIQANGLARARDLRPLLLELFAAGVTSQNGIARELIARRIPTARGGKWTNVQVRDLLRRLDASHEGKRWAA